MPSPAAFARFRRSRSAAPPRADLPPAPAAAPAARPAVPSAQARLCAAAAPRRRLPRRALLLPVALMAAGCGDPELRARRNALLNDDGPYVEKAGVEQQKELEALVMELVPDPETDPHIPWHARDADGAITATYYGPNSADPSRPNMGDRLALARQSGFAIVERGCLEYLDSIYWAQRTKETLGGLVTLSATPLPAVLTPAGTAATTVAAITAALGLGGKVADELYDTYLYALEPSALLATLEVTAAEFRNGLYRDSERLHVDTPGELVRQLQAYAKHCTPIAMEATANGLIKQGAQAFQPLTAEEDAELAALLKKGEMGRLTTADGERLTQLKLRKAHAGLVDTGAMAAETESDAKMTPKDGDGASG